MNDFRFNISHAKGATTVVPTNFGGATPPTSAYLFQSNPTYSIQSSVFALTFNDSTTDYYVGNDATNHQRQLNYVDTLSWSHGKLQLQVRRLPSSHPHQRLSSWDIGYDFDTVQSLVQTQIPDYASVDTTDTTELRPVFNNLSFFAQDSWQLTPRLTLNYGVRWDYDPPPSESTGHPFYTALNLNDPANVSLAPKGTPLWDASKHNFAPRLGFSYVIHQNPGLETVLRGGGGIFYGLGNQQGRAGNTRFPYSRSEYLYGTNPDGTPTGIQYPLTQAQAAPIPFTLDPPYTYVYAFDPHLRDPRVYMWNLGLQQNLGNNRSMKLTYVGNIGSDLLRNEMLTPAMGGNANFQYLDVITNHDYANYNALQFEFKQQLWHHLQVLATYTWSHALDNGSGVALPVPYHTVYSPTLDYGDSDFDVRNTFTNAITYELPKVIHGNGVLKYLANGWAVDSLFRSNTAAPLTVTTGIYSYGLEWNTTAINQRPNVVPGQPFYLNEPGQPGGRVINPLPSPHLQLPSPRAISPATHSAASTSGRKTSPSVGHSPSVAMLCFSSALKPSTYSITRSSVM